MNDEQAIGRWQLIGLSKSKEDYYHNDLLESDDYMIKDLYLMENGEKYWVISWSKNIIYINGRENPYEIENNLMFVKIKGYFDSDECKIVVYKKIDSNRYKPSEIGIKDNVDVEFHKDENVIGFWNSVDFVHEIDLFIPGQKTQQELFLKKINISPNGETMVVFADNTVKNAKYTNGYIINLCLDNTLCKYKTKTIEGKTYMFVEWKSGDYVYGNMIKGYYVLEKI